MKSVAVAASSSLAIGSGIRPQASWKSQNRARRSTWVARSRALKAWASIASGGWLCPMPGDVKVSASWSIGGLLKESGEESEIERLLGRPVPACRDGPAPKRRNGPLRKGVFFGADRLERARRPYRIERDALPLDQHAKARRAVQGPTPVCRIRPVYRTRLRHHHRAELKDQRRNQRCVPAHAHIEAGTWAE